MTDRKPHPCEILALGTEGAVRMVTYDIVDASYRPRITQDFTAEEATRIGRFLIACAARQPGSWWFVPGNEDAEAQTIEKETRP